MLRVTRTILPYMRSQRDGLIIYISSIAGRLHLPMMAVYNPSKCALESITENLRFETAPLGIDNVIIEPGAFGTEIYGKFLQPAEPERTASYGGIEKMPAHMGALLQAADAPDPQWIADAVKALIDEGQGSRPFRTVVGTLGTPGVVDLNAAGEKYQQELYPSLGVGSA